MDKRLKTLIKSAHIERATVLALIFTIMSFVLVHRLYRLQIIDGATYSDLRDKLSEEIENMEYESSDYLLLRQRVPCHHR